MREFQESNPTRVFAMQFTGDNLAEIAEACPNGPSLAVMQGAVGVLQWPNSWKIALVPEDWLVVEGGNYRPMTDGDFYKKYEPICDHEWEAMSLTKNGKEIGWCERCDWYRSEQIGSCRE